MGPQKMLRKWFRAIAKWVLNQKDVKQAKKNGIAFRVAKMNYDFMSRAIAMRQKKGFIKLIVSDDEEMTILGMRVLGVHASSTIEAIALLISLKKSVRILAELIHAHPSIPEGIQELA